MSDEFVFNDDELAKVMNSEAQKSLKSAKSDEKAEQVKTPGIYRMRVDSKKFKNNKDGTVITTPNFFFAKDTKNFCLTVNLVVVDGTLNAPSGSYIIQNFVLAAGEMVRNSPKMYESFQKALNISKSRLGALIGRDIVKNASFDATWVREYLSSDFDAQFNETRHHKMNNEVMVKLEPHVYNNKDTVQLSAIAIAKAGDHSIEDTSVAVPPPSAQHKDFGIIEDLQAADTGSDPVEVY
jgi:hypothetical protein